MEFKSRDGITMVWVENLHKIVKFTKGIAKVDEKTGIELKKMGFIENSEKSLKKSEVNNEEKSFEHKTKFIKPIKPIVEKVGGDDPINCEV